MEFLKKIINPKLNMTLINWVLLGYRICISLAIIFIHGAKKITHFQEEVQHIPDPFNMGGYAATLTAIFSNIVCAVFVGLGLFTRPFALGALSVPLIGFLIVHGNDPWTVRDIPMMYSIAFLVILILGPGKHSVDNWLFNKLK